jgi:hypothetical protein
VSALDVSVPLDKHRCHEHLHRIARGYDELGLVDVCGKCAIGPCSFGSAVPVAWQSAVSEGLEPARRDL